MSPKANANLPPRAVSSLISCLKVFLSIVFFKYCEYKDTTVLLNLDKNYCFSLLQRNECHVKNDLFLKEKYCQQRVNILSITDNNDTICHLCPLGTHIALKVSEVRKRFASERKGSLLPICRAKLIFIQIGRGQRKEPENDGRAPKMTNN